MKLKIGDKLKLKDGSSWKVNNQDKNFYYIKDSNNVTKKIRKTSKFSDEYYTISKKAEPYKSGNNSGIQTFEKYYDDETEEIITTITTKIKKTQNIEEYIEAISDKDIVDTLNCIAEKTGDSLCYTKFLYKGDLNRYPELKSFCLNKIGKERLAKAPDSALLCINENAMHSSSSENYWGTSASIFENAKRFLIAEGVHNMSYFIPTFVEYYEKLK